MIVVVQRLTSCTMCRWDLVHSARPGNSTETRIERTGRKVLNFMYFCSTAGKLTLPTQESIIR